MSQEHLDQTIRVYWMPGCSSCLRMKEFIEKSGRRYEAINVDESDEAKEMLAARGLLLPVTCLNDQCVTGTDLAAVANLLRVPYAPPKILSPQDLIDRYDVNQAAGCRFLAQMTPEILAHHLPGRERAMLDVAYQVAMVARSFLSAYHADNHDIAYYSMPEGVTSQSQVLELGAETRRLIREWWEQDGIDDPLDRVVTTYWGHPSLHEILEREVWHTTQHVRQLMYCLEECGIPPDEPLTESNLAGLPLPERVHG
jgi:glutaredoxin